LNLSAAEAKEGLAILNEVFEKPPLIKAAA